VNAEERIRELERSNDPLRGALIAAGRVRQRGKKTRDVQGEVVLVGSSE
jgi:2-keto-4-pentenoate hydratase